MGILWMAVCAPPLARINYSVSWIGNSYGGAVRWVQQDIKSIHVTPDGTVYAVCEWDEAGRELGVYRNGEAVAMAGHSHGWGYHGGTAVAVNRKYVFFAQSVENEGGGLVDPGTWPPKGRDWFGVSRRLRSDITRGAPFPGGKGGSGDTLKGCFLLVNEVRNGTDAAIRGLCATETRLYVSDPFGKRIRVYDAESMAELKSWAVERPDQMAMADDGMLWVVQKSGGGQPARILSFSPEGSSAGRIDLPSDCVPTALCFDGQGRLLVADNGPRQQVLIFSGLRGSAKLVGTLGRRGGIYSGVPGQFGPLRFNTPTGVGCDAEGNIYVACDGSTGGGGTVLECYSPSRKLRWRLFGLEFVDMADVDPASDADVFTKEEHFRVSYPSGGPTRWTYAGYTVNRFKYPQDPRLHVWSAGVWVRRLQGRRFLFVNDMNAEYLQVYRFDVREGETAIPCGLFTKRHVDQRQWPPHQPAKGEWIWRDLDGDGAFDAGEYASNGGRDAPPAQGWWVDEDGNVWLATETDGIRMLRLKGISAKGVPMWDYEAMRTFPKPVELREVKRIRYYPKQDVLYLGGTTQEHTNQHWKPMGPVICRYDGWLRGARRLKWRVVAPYEKGSSGHASCEPMTFDAAGEYVFVPYTGAGRSLGFSTGHIEVLRASDGRRAGSMEPSAQVGEIGLQDIRECIRAHRRASGEYVVFLEEDWKAKVLVYRWKP